MNKVLYFTVGLICVLFSCEDIYDEHAEFRGEVVYPARYDTIIGNIGYERVELDLFKAGRIPSSQLNLGKAVSTRIEYEDKEILIDSLVSYVNISGLTQSKLYRFDVFTVDEFGNNSVPQNIALIPYTNEDLNNLVVAPPRIVASPSAAVVEWPLGLSSVLMEYLSLEYSYVDNDGVTKSGTAGETPRFFIGNIKPGQPIDINMTYHVVPRINQQNILDTIAFDDVITINMPLETTEFSPAERQILIDNGITTFTAQAISSVEKLVYPVHTNSLQDIFYFPNIKEIDLTGGDLFDLPSLIYDRNDVVDEVGGGKYVPFIKKSGGISVSDYQVLIDFLDAGILEKVTYYANSMGLDEALAPYVETGIVEIIENPAESLIPNEFHLDGIVQDHNWSVEVDYPVTDAPNPNGADLSEVYKVNLRARNATFVFALPAEYEFKTDDYKYLKMSVLAPEKSFFAGKFEPYQRLWPRFMNNMWSFGQNSNFGQEYWAKDPFYIPDEALNTWHEVTIDLADAVGKHNRVIVLNIGGEPGGIGDWDPPADIVYYFANMRFTKE
ncbi:DUF4998 domain-containing protein [Portibacter lacus]|uniref:DUF4959 domain-containing protein n=1 Tax=Portibacter lacus TaxID=1099794 RepID=A0AA37WDU4_9BACT|nr:DUF4998 domain-containing protein [Portibacter lacus]GLR18206.1 hypothetical protein GCM10007940_28210 [Portibacter lacus]